MKFIRKQLWIVLSIALMAGCMYGFRIYVSTTEINQTTVQTLKPLRTLQAGEVIDPNLLQMSIVSNKEHHGEAITDLKQLAGKVVVVPIGKDEEIVPWKISTVRTQPTPDERYVSFKTDSVINVNDMVRKGDRVDVWVEFDKPRTIRYKDAIRVIGAVKVIENLPIASVKNGDGLEITDSDGNRGKPSSKPDANTYLMTDDTYNAYSLAQLSGKIKLAMPGLTQPQDPSKKGTVTTSYTTLKDSGFFTKSGNVDAKGDIKETDVQATAPPSTSTIADPTGSQQSNSQPNPQSPFGSQAPAKEEPK